MWLFDCVGTTAVNGFRTQSVGVGRAARDFWAYGRHPYPVLRSEKCATCILSHVSCHGGDSFQRAEQTRFLLCEP